MVPATRIREANNNGIQSDGDYVLYWMIANRRRRFNFALQRAVEWAAELRKPLVVLEGLNNDYPWASDRIHAFIIEGMRSNERDFKKSGVTYHPLIGDSAHRFAKRAAVAVTDDYPAFVIPRWTESLAARCPAPVECVDSSCLFPFRLAPRVFKTAHSFRRFLQKELPRHIDQLPLEDPLKDLDLPRLSMRNLEGIPRLEDLPIDHSVQPVAGIEGGSAAATSQLRRFLQSGLHDYAEQRNDLDSSHASGLAPYLHFGHISAHELFNELARRERWHAGKLGAHKNGSRVGWWGFSADTEAFLDQLITWRELGFNRCATDANYDQYSSLPDWARRTLKRHSRDKRPRRYSLDEFEHAATHDPLWNAAQRQLLVEGRIHNYLRMLWGKKILEWTTTPEEALAIMIQLNNKYALDGRDPNSYSGIFWILGRYDRPWGPERPIFGTVRYMSSENTARKLDVSGYLRQFGNGSALQVGNQQNERHRTKQRR
jgi:deoxyribodipyrimidine photo-lyase